MKQTYKPIFEDATCSIPTLALLLALLAGCGGGQSPLTSSDEAPAIDLAAKPTLIRAIWAGPTAKTVT